MLRLGQQTVPGRALTAVSPAAHSPSVRAPSRALLHSWTSHSASPVASSSRFTLQSPPLAQTSHFRCISTSPALLKGKVKRKAKRQAEQSAPTGRQGEAAQSAKQQSQKQNGKHSGRQSTSEHERAAVARARAKARADRRAGRNSSGDASFGHEFSNIHPAMGGARRGRSHALRWKKYAGSRNVAQTTRGQQDPYFDADFGQHMRLLSDAEGQIYSNLAHTVEPESTDGRRRRRRPVRHGTLDSESVRYTPVAPLREMKVASLSHGLDRVLFNPGVHVLRDPRTGIYNYSPSLNKIPDVDLFDLSALPPYVTSSKDEELLYLAHKHNAKFCGSTSSLTAMLSQVYFLVSGWKRPNFDNFTQAFNDSNKNFSDGARMPASIKLTPISSSEGDHTTWAIDSDKDVLEVSDNSNYILAQLGKSMEKMLTVSPEEYQTYLRVNRPDQTPSKDDHEREAYHYALAGNSMLMRSQLDCTDDRLPGKTFDLKTRAVVSIRSDRANWFEATGYQITKQTGRLESFERERFDMLRAAFLKYYLQARIGCMDGIFVAYHNAAKTFGFEYFPIEQMAEQLFGSTEFADQAFKLSVGLSEKILERAVSLFPGNKQLHLTFETKDLITTDPDAQGENPDMMHVYVEEADPDKPYNVFSTPQIARLDVIVDRYINGSLVKGAVDFKSTLLDSSAHAADEQVEEEESVADEQVKDEELAADPQPEQEESAADAQVKQEESAAVDVQAEQEESPADAQVKEEELPTADAQAEQEELPAADAQAEQEGSPADAQVKQKDPLAADAQAEQEGLPADAKAEPEDEETSGQGAKGATPSLSPPSPPRLTLDYKIRREWDLTSQEIRESLSLVRERQNAICQMAMPNIDSVNDRERRLQAELSRNPLALQRYTDDKRNGVAVGLPRAPGQVELFLDDDASAKVVVEDEETWKKPSRAVEKLRELSRAGAAAIQGEEDDVVRVYKSRS